MVYLQKDETLYHLKTELLRKKFQNFYKTFEEIEGKLFRKNKFGLNKKVVITDEVEAILYLYHDDLVAGHLGFNKLYKKLIRSYYWPKMFEEV